MPTQIAKSIKQDGSGDYTTIAGFAAAITANLVTANEYWTGTINDSNNYAENVSFTGVTADATRSVTLTVGSGQTPTITGSTIAVWCNIKNMTMAGAGGLKLRASGTNAECCRPNQPGVVVQDCNLQRSGTPAGTVGVSIRGGAATIQRNVFTNLHRGLIFGDGFGDNSVIRNNLFYSTISNNLDMNSGAVNGVLIYHNSFDATGSNSCIVVRNTSTPTNVIKNNIIRCANGYCLYLGPVANANGIDSDNNRFHVTGTGYVAAISTTNYATLADWQAATVHDDASASGAPSWTDPSSADYTLTASDNGATGLGVTDDILGRTRAATPDRGCYEYVVPAAPTNPSAGADSSTQITVGWTDNSDIETGFEIDRAPDSGGSPGAFVLVHTTAAGVTSWANSGLSASTTYWYRIRAIGTYANSTYTSNISATTDSGGTAYTYTGTGGATTSGGASKTNAVSYAGTGSATTSGTASETQALATIGSGGAVSGGEATPTKALVVGASGGATTSGSGSTTKALSATATGGADTSGSGSTTKALTQTASGGATTSGSESTTKALSATATGGADASGGATQTQALSYQASGSVVVTGSATAVIIPAPPSPHQRIGGTGRGGGGGIYAKPPTRRTWPAPQELQMLIDTGRKHSVFIVHAPAKTETRTFFIHPEPVVREVIRPVIVPLGRQHFTPLPPNPPAEPWTGKDFFWSCAALGILLLLRHWLSPSED